MKPKSPQLSRGGATAKLPPAPVRSAAPEDAAAAPPLTTSAQPFPQLLTFAEAAARLRISRWTVRRLVREGTVPVVTLSPRIRRILETDLPTIASVIAYWRATPASAASLKPISQPTAPNKTKGKHERDKGTIINHHDDADGPTSSVACTSGLNGSC